MKSVMIINEDTDTLLSHYQIKENNVNKEMVELKKLYTNVSVDNDQNIVVFK